MRTYGLKIIEKTAKIFSQVTHFVSVLRLYQKMEFLMDDIAEMNDLDQIKMRHMVRKVLKRVKRPVKHLKMAKKTA